MAFAFFLQNWFNAYDLPFLCLVWVKKDWFSLNPDWYGTNRILKYGSNTHFYISPMQNLDDKRYWTLSSAEAEKRGKSRWDKNKASPPNTIASVKHGDGSIMPWWWTVKTWCDFIAWFRHMSAKIFFLFIIIIFLPNKHGSENKSSSWEFSPELE